jgi:hypothetical protein
MNVYFLRICTNFIIKMIFLGFTFSRINTIKITSFQLVVSKEALYGGKIL